MANEMHVDILKNGVEAWNSWRARNPQVIPDLTEIDLSGRDFTKANFNKVQFNGTNLSNTLLESTDLSEANLSIVRFDTLYSNYYSTQESIQVVEELKSRSDYEYWMDIQDSVYGVAMQIQYNQERPYREKEKLERALLSSKNAQLLGSVASKSMLVNSCLMGANLRGANLFGASLMGANLTSSNLSEVHAICVDFEGANLTGACIANWNINNETNFNGVICDHIYLLEGHKERRPLSGEFSSREFTTLFQIAFSTIDLIFVNGIDWNAFYITFQELELEYENSGLSIQAIERKSDRGFIVRLEVNSDANRASIERRAQVLYEEKIKSLEAQYHAELKAKDREIGIHIDHNAELKEIIRLQANRPIIVEAKAVATSQSDSNTFNNDLHSSKIGNFANQVQDSGLQQANQYNYTSVEELALAEAAHEIQRLLRQLEQTNPAATETEQIAYINVAVKQDLKHRAIAALKAGTDTAIDEFFLENKYLKVGKSVIKAWLQPSK